MNKALCLTRDRLGLDVHLGSESTSEPVARLDRASVSRIVHLLLGFVHPWQEIPANVSECYLLTDADLTWLVQLLCLALDSRSTSIRRRAVLSLPIIAGPQALRFLQPALRDEDDSVRWVARYAMSLLERGRGSVALHSAPKPDETSSLPCCSREARISTAAAPTAHDF